jgi:hypothetical protein
MNIKSVVISILSLVLTVAVFVGILKVFNFSTFKTETKTENKGKESEIKAFKLPDTLTFGGDKVPLEYFDVSESLDNELLSVGNFHSQAIKNIKRTVRYFPIIEPILKKNKIPNDFKYLAVAESNLENVSSAAGAHGFWQFLKETGAEYGLEINEAVDERYHLEKSTQAACEYLNNAYKVYKDWALVASAYNYGRGNVNKQLERQKVNSYYDLHLNTETGRYVYRILAIKLIFNNPDKYNLHLDSDDMYPILQTKQVTVDSTITSLIDFAKTQNTNYKVLKILNPWLRSDNLPNPKKKTYLIKVPVENGRVIKKGDL